MAQQRRFRADTDAPDVRDYMYVDLPRVRSLLAQLHAGIPEGESRAQSRSSKLGASLKGLFSGERQWGTEEQETRALADLHLAMLEEDAEELGLLRDVTAEAQSEEAWDVGRVAKHLTAGSLLRVTAPTQIVDPPSLVSIWKRFNKVASSAGGSELPDAPSDAEDFGQFLAAGLGAALGGAQPSDGEDEVTSLLGAAYTDFISMRVLPCGAEALDHAFTGLITDSKAFIGAERAALFSRLGPDPTTWTTVALVARVPTQDGTAEPSDDSPWSRLEKLGEQMVKDAKQEKPRLDRAVMDQMLLEIMRLLEDFGMQDAPRWPTISITPLAVYRVVPFAGPAAETDN